MSRTDPRGRRYHVAKPGERKAISESVAARAGLTASEGARVQALHQARHTPNQIAALTRLPYRAIRVALGLPP